MTDYTNISHSHNKNSPFPLTPLQLNESPEVPALLGASIIQAASYVQTCVRTAHTGGYIMWNGSFLNETGNYNISADSVSIPETNMLTLTFYVRKNGTPDAWNITFRLPGCDRVEMSRERDVTELMWKHGSSIIDSSSKLGRLRNGDFLLNDLNLNSVMTLDDVEELG